MRSNHWMSVLALVLSACGGPQALQAPWKSAEDGGLSATGAGSGKGPQGSSMLFPGLGADGGSTVGNGGSGFHCINAATGEEKAMLLDFFEAEAIYKITPDLGPEETDVTQQVLKVLDRISMVDPHRARALGSLAWNFMREAEFLPGSALLPVADTLHIAAPEIPGFECRHVQLALQMEPKTKLQKRYNVSARFYDLLPPAHRAGLILHEIIYRHFIEEDGDTDSVKTRLFLNMLVDGTTPDYASMMNYLIFLNDLGTTFEVLRGVRLEALERWSGSFSGRVRLLAKGAEKLNLSLQGVGSHFLRAALSEGMELVFWKADGIQIIFNVPINKLHKDHDLFGLQPPYENYHVQGIAARLVLDMQSNVAAISGYNPSGTAHEGRILLFSHRQLSVDGIKAAGSLQPKGLIPATFLEFQSDGGGLKKVFISPGPEQQRVTLDSPSGSLELCFEDYNTLLFDSKKLALRQAKLCNGGGFLMTEEGVPQRYDGREAFFSPEGKLRLNLAERLGPGIWDEGLINTKVEKYRYEADLEEIGKVLDDGMLARSNLWALSLPLQYDDLRSMHFKKMIDVAGGKPRQVYFETSAPHERGLSSKQVLWWNKETLGRPTNIVGVSANLHFGAGTVKTNYFDASQTGKVVSVVDTYRPRTIRMVFPAEFKTEDYQVRIRFEARGAFEDILADLPFGKIQFDSDDVHATEYHQELSLDGKAFSFGGEVSFPWAVKDFFWVTSGKYRYRTAVVEVALTGKGGIKAEGLVQTYPLDIAAEEWVVNVQPLIP